MKASHDSWFIVQLIAIIMYVVQGWKWDSMPYQYFLGQFQTLPYRYFLSRFQTSLVGLKPYLRFLLEKRHTGVLRANTNNNACKCAITGSVT